MSWCRWLTDLCRGPVARCPPLWVYFAFPHQQRGDESDDPARADRSAGRAGARWCWPDWANECDAGACNSHASLVAQIDLLLQN